jgi:hypothetical protein
MRKFVRTPPTSIAIFDWRGNPSCNINDHRIIDVREQTGTAQRIGRTGCKRQRRELGCKLGRHQGAVVLADIKRTIELSQFQRTGKRLYDTIGKRQQTCVQQCCVFPLEQAQSTDVVRPGDAHSGMAFNDSFGDIFFLRRIGGRKYAGHGNELDVL